MRGRRGIRKPANLGVQRATITREPLQHACILAKPFNETLLRTPYPAWRYDLPNLSTQRQMHSVEVSCYPTFDSSNSKNVITTTAVLLPPGSRVARRLPRFDLVIKHNTLRRTLLTSLPVVLPTYPVLLSRNAPYRAVKPVPNPSLCPT